MPDPDSGQQTAARSGEEFFRQAEQIAKAGKLDLAMHLYLEGIRRQPDAVARGHQGLRRLSLRRLQQGGRPAGFLEQLNHRRAKDPLDALTNAEYLLAKDPQNLAHMLAALKAARRLEAPALIEWICQLLLGAMQKQDNPGREVRRQVAEALRAVRPKARIGQLIDPGRGRPPAS